MDIDQLQTFERIAREGSFSRAAHSLNLAQPTISTRIQMLEAEVGGALFIRNGRKVALTERGESFLPFAQRALAVLAEGVEVSQLTQTGSRGRVTVGTIQSLTDNFLTATIVEFHHRHPQVELFIRTGHSNHIEEMLYDGIVKIGVMSWPFLNPDFVPLLYMREELVFVAPPKHKLAKQGTVSAEDIHIYAHPLLVIQWGPAMNILLGKIFPHAERVMEVPIHNAHELLLQGIGASFLTRTFVAKDLAAGRLVEIPVHDLPTSYRDSVLVRLSRYPTLPTATLDFISVLCEQASASGISVSEQEL